MKWSWRLGHIAGIGVYVHATFPLLLAWVALSQLSGGATAIGVLYALAMILVVFGIVVAHELGHALMARRFGIATRDITLLPIGGIARLERMPREPKQELAIALAGPAVNLVLAFVCSSLTLPQTCISTRQARTGGCPITTASRYPTSSSRRSRLPGRTACCSEPTRRSFRAGGTARCTTRR